MAAGQDIPSGFCGAWVHAAIRMSALNVQAERIVWVVILEMVVALALAVFIIWFTWPKKRPPGDK